MPLCRESGHVRTALLLSLAGVPLLWTVVTLFWPWLVVTGSSPIPFLTDTNATYGVFCFSPKTGVFDAIEITGEFPRARYVSFMVYGGSSSKPFSVLTDYEMQPDFGSINPFVPLNDRSVTNRRYTIHAIREGSGIDPSSYDNVLMIPASEDFINIMMRVYRPDDGLDILGSVPLPTVQVMRAGGPVTVPRYGLTSDLAQLVDMFFVVQYEAAESYSRLHDDLGFEFYHFSREGGLSNGDIPYLEAALGGAQDGHDSRLAVVTFRPPTFEDTHLGGGTLSGNKDVRYYSFCTSDVATGFNNRCVSDNELKVDQDGTVTLVVYPPDMEAQVMRSGLNRLGRVYSETASLTYRQLLPSRDFVGSAARVPLLPLPVPQDVDLGYYRASVYLGDYAPKGVYFTSGEFEAWLRHRQVRPKPRG